MGLIIESWSPGFNIDKKREKKSKKYLMMGKHMNIKLLFLPLDYESML